MVCDDAREYRGARLERRRAADEDELLLGAREGDVDPAGVAEEFAEVDCKTCHGKDPKAAEFKMPSPDLHKLDPADNFAHEKADHPDEVKFMMEVFTPKMVELLGEKPFDPATGEGFGCFSCHTRK